MKKRLPEWIF